MSRNLALACGAALVGVLAVLSLCAVARTASASTILYSEGWDTGPGEWTPDGGVWLVDSPSGGPGQSRTGQRCAFVQSYPANADTRLIGPDPIAAYGWLLPADPLDGELWLRFWQWYDIEWSDRGRLEISRDGGPWEELPEASVGGHGGGVWTQALYDLSAYQGSRIRIAFRFLSDGYYEWTGWYVDDVTVEQGALQVDFPLSFESGAADLAVEGGSWEVGAPGEGPSRAHRGDACAGVLLGAGYHAGLNARLVIPQTLLPTPADGKVWLRFWQWYDIEWSDAGVVEISQDGGPWEELTGSRVAGHGGGIWTPAVYDLSAYAGSRVRISFRFASDGYYEWSGWYIDDVSIEAGALALNNPEDFDAGFANWFQQKDGWSVQGGTWQIGRPHGGPGAPHSGLECAGTVLDAAYPAGASARLVSPTYSVPATPVGGQAWLSFWQWYDIEWSDSGVVEVSRNGGPWEALAESQVAGHGGGVWSQAACDLAPYAGSDIRIAFHLTADGYYEWSGWYVDDIAVVEGPLSHRGAVDGFEEGIGCWSAPGGQWEVGTPDAGAGPGAAYAGSRCAGTVLAGAYAAGANARLTAPPHHLVRINAAQPIRLKWRHWFSFGPGDFGVVEVSADGGAWQPLATFSGVGGGVWSLAQVDLTPYENSTVRLAFRLVSDGYYEDAGWYVDEVEVTNIDLARPAAAANLAVEYGTDPLGSDPPLTRPQLTWSASPAPDLAYYAVYRGRTEDFTPDLSTRIAVVTTTSYTDLGAHGASFHYLVSAVDGAGNESLAAAPSTITAAPPAGGPVAAGRAVLESNFPNPFNPSTTIRFSVPVSQHVELGLYDLRGRLVARLLDGVLPAGSHDVVLDARDLASGVYLYRLRTDDGVAARTMTLAK